MVAQHPYRDLFLAMPAFWVISLASCTADKNATVGKPAEPKQNDAHAVHAESTIAIPADLMKRFGIEITKAGPGTIERTLMLPAEIRLNGDRVAHIVPRVSGMVREVRKDLGDSVPQGEIMAILDSRELADAKAADLAAASRLALAKKDLERVEGLFAEKIAPEKELLRARQSMAEIEIDHRTAEAKLHALGFTQQQVEGLHSQRDTDYPRYEIKAPFAGTVIEKHIALGEVVNQEANCFVLADLSDVWVDITIYPQDFPNVSVNQAVNVIVTGATPAQSGRIAYVSPRIDDTTRTGMARVKLPNFGGRLRPGMFVRADLLIATEDAAIVVPDSAIQTIDGRSVVFVQEHGGFSKRFVVIGRRNESRCELLSGLKPGERYAMAGTFLLKAEFGKAQAEDGD